MSWSCSAEYNKWIISFFGIPLFAIIRRWQRDRANSGNLNFQMKFFHMEISAESLFFTVQWNAQILIKIR